jgi:putative hemolysin
VLNELHGWNLPEADAYDTLGGLILHEVEDIPEEGMAVSVPPFKFVVREVAENRIVWIEFVPVSEG